MSSDDQAGFADMVLNSLLTVSGAALISMPFADNFRRDVGEAALSMYNQGAAQVEELTEGLDTYREESRIQAKVNQAKEESNRVNSPASSQNHGALGGSKQVLDGSNHKKGDNQEYGPNERTKSIGEAVEDLFLEKKNDSYSIDEGNMEEAKEGFETWPERFGVHWAGIAGQMLRERGWRDIGEAEPYKGWGEITTTALEEVQRKADEYLDEEEMQEFSELVEDSKRAYRGSVGDALDHNQELNVAVASGYIKVLQETENYGKFDVDRAMQEPFIWDLEEDGDMVYFLDENMSGEERAMMEEYWRNLPTVEDDREVRRLDKGEMREYMEENGMPLQQAHLGYCWGHAPYGDNLGNLGVKSPYMWETGKYTLQNLEESSKTAE